MFKVFEMSFAYIHVPDPLHLLISISRIIEPHRWLHSSYHVATINMDKTRLVCVFVLLYLQGTCRRKCARMAAAQKDVSVGCDYKHLRSPCWWVSGMHPILVDTCWWNRHVTSLRRCVIIVLISVKPISIQFPLTFSQCLPRHVRLCHHCVGFC